MKRTERRTGRPQKGLLRSSLSQRKDRTLYCCCPKEMCIRDRGESGLGALTLIGQIIDHCGMQHGLSLIHI